MSQDSSHRLAPDRFKTSALSISNGSKFDATPWFGDLAEFPQVISAVALRELQLLWGSGGSVAECLILGVLLPRVAAVGGPFLLDESHPSP
jgi:hypothetical protein